jgi:carbon storage regulator
MLVITRKNGEQLIIGHDIEVTVLKIRGNQVKLGIRGPADVPIHRKELQSRMLHPSPDTTCRRTVSAGLTTEELKEETRGSLGVGRPSGQVSGIAATLRRRWVCDREVADRELERRIKNFLQGRNLPGLSDLEVEVRNGTAVITGLGGTFYQKQLATSCCQRVAGVLSVLNDVQVTDLPAARERGS